jgi:alpha-mannosidase
MSLLIILVSNVTLGQISKRPQIDDTTYMLTYDHGGLILWGSDHFRERLKNAIEWLDKYPSFKIGLDNEAQIYDYFAENEPQLLKELNDLLQKYKGRFAIGSCTYGQPLSQFINDESNIRQISYALESERKYLNYRPPVYLMSEHAMHSQIPQIIKGFGFDGAIMRTHFMMYGYNPTFDVPIGWWVGLDGSKIATIPTYVDEGAAFAKTTVDNWILTRYPGNDAKESMESYRKKFEHINPLLASRADDSGLRKEELVREYETKPKFSWILLDNLLSKYPTPKVEMVTKPNDFVVRMPWGYCGNQIWNDSRKAETSVLTAERLAAVEVLNGGQSHETDLDISWKNLLLAQHHDIQICGLLPEARKLLSVSIKKSEQSINASMAFFAENMIGEGFKQVTVFNPLSWKQTRWIFANVALQKGAARTFVAKCGEKKIRVRIIESNKFSDGTILDARIVFKVELAPLSLTSYSILPSEDPNEILESLIRTDENNLVSVTPYYEIKLSKEGGIISIKDIKTGDYITKGNQRTAFFEGKIDGVPCQSSGKWIIKKSSDNTPWTKMVEHGFISNIPYEFEMTFYEDNPRIDCKVKFDFNGQKIGFLSDNLRDGHSPFVHEEKLRFKFFPKLDTAAIGIRDLPFAIAETNNKYVEGNYWTAISDGKSGVAYFNKGNMGSVRERDNSFSIPLAYSMYYVWGTRMLYGSYNYEFAILPFSGNWKEASLQKRALEYSFDVPTIDSKPNSGKLGNNINTFSIEAEDNVLLTGLYPQKDIVVARFFKSDDQAPVTPINFERKGTILVETNLDGRFIRNINGKIDFKSWEIKTIQIQLK